MAVTSSSPFAAAAGDGSSALVFAGQPSEH